MNDSLRRRLSMFAVLASTLAMGDIAMAQEVKVVPLLSRELVGVPNEEGTMITVAFAPGESDPVHRHNAHVFVYVLEGSVIMQVKGQRQVTLVAGQTFYESPSDIHIVGRNASATNPAKILVFFVKKKGAPILVPVKSN